MSELARFNWCKDYGKLDVNKARVRLLIIHYSSETMLVSLEEINSFYRRVKTFSRSQ